MSRQNDERRFDLSEERKTRDRGEKEARKAW
jgi:hypothetical protein